MARLLHFVNAETGAEYVVIQDDEDIDEEEYAVPGFEVSNTADILDDVSRMPTDRSLRPDA